MYNHLDMLDYFYQKDSRHIISVVKTLNLPFLGIQLYRLLDVTFAYLLNKKIITKKELRKLLTADVIQKMSEYNMDALIYLRQFYNI